MGFYKVESRLEDCVMLSLSLRCSTAISRGAVIAAAACGLFLAGCDEHVQVIRDPEIPIAKHSTWAWKPMEARNDARNGVRDPGREDRRVISRDVIGRGGENAVREEEDPATAIDRRRFKTEIERQLTAKGLTQVSDPGVADFVLDYHFAVRNRNATVPVGYPGYGGLVCGPYGCWNGWGYGAVGYERIRFREGTFVLDLLQTRSKRLAYRAVGEEPAYKVQFSQDQIQDMVHALLKGLKTVGK
jgi:Domain of unknown function (DUF4136)